VIALVVRGPNLAERRVEWSGGTLDIGRSEVCNVVLPGDGITRLHARITVAPGRAVLHDAASTNGTFLNGVRIGGPVALARHDRITIGAYTLEILRADESPRLPPAALSADPAEAALLAELERTGEPAALLLVYADWLEQTGQPRRAALLRVQHELAARAPGAPRDRDSPKQRKQLRRLAAADDLGWRVLVSRAPIERCTHPPGAGCPGEWIRLARTGREDVRACGACGQPVFYCTTLEDARGHALRGDRIAVDASTGRTPGDLDLAAPPGRPA
jgi:uncharacterized protein (TIGR02996 family)